MRTKQGWWRLAAWTPVVLVAASATSGCKTLNERYIDLEVWKYEKCFGHPPPGFVGKMPAQPPMAPPPMQPCAGGVPYQQPAQGCDVCAGAPLPAGAMGGGPIMGGPMVAPGPAGAGVTAGRPVVISDEVVLP